MHTTTPSWSCCFIARNEEETLPRMLESLRPFKELGGNIVVLDTGSGDKTAQVARDFGCAVEEVGDKFRIKIDGDLAEKINERFIIQGEAPVVSAGDSLFDFASARNYAASLAKNDMVSMQDCDEVYTALAIEAVEEKIREGYEQFEYHFVFSHDAFGNEAVKFTQSKFYNRKKMQWNGIVHEVLSGEAKRCFLPENILKLEHWQNEKTNRSGYLKGLALDCFLHPDNDRNSHYFGRELVWTGRPHSAIKELTRHVAMKRWPAERAQSMIFIGEAMMNLGEKEAAAAAWHEAYRIEAGRREPLIRLANLAFGEDDKQRAVAYAEAALTIPRSYFYADNEAHYTNVPHEILYWAYWWLGDKEKSKKHFDIAFAYLPKNPKYLHDRQFYYPNEMEYTSPGIDGYMRPEELEFLYQTAKSCHSILEIGSWKGRSTHALLSGCKGTVTAVDTFGGSTDPKDWTYAQARESDIYAEFKKNVGHFENLEVIHSTSKEAAERLKDRMWDMIFIDATHTYDAVKEDIALWKDKAKVILCGHDYVDSWPEVIRAVDESLGKPEKVTGTIWQYPIRIPKKIFTIWLSEDGSEKHSKFQKIPGYEHKCLTNKDCPDIPYIQDALRAKKWVKAADYLRLYVLYHEGGIYLDSDVDVLPGKNFDDMLDAEVFVGQEENGFIANSVIGARKGHPILAEAMDRMEMSFRGDDDKIFESGMETFSQVASSYPEVSIFPPEVFFPYNHQTGIIKAVDNSRTFHHFAKSWTDDQPDILPRVSIILPTLGREDGLRRCLESIERLSYPRHLIQTIVIDGEGTVPEKVARGLSGAMGDYVVYAANDMVFSPDSLYIAIKESQELGKGLVSFNEGPLLPDEGNICAHFLISKGLIFSLGGEIFDTEMHHVGVDNLLWAKAKKMGQAHHSENAKIEHFHFSHGSPMDEVYSKGWSRVEEDRAILKRKLLELEQTI